MKSHLTVRKPDYDALNLKKIFFATRYLNVDQSISVESKQWISVATEMPSVVLLEHKKALSELIGGRVWKDK